MDQRHIFGQNASRDGGSSIVERKKSRLKDKPESLREALTSSVCDQQCRSGLWIVATKYARNILSALTINIMRGYYHESRRQSLSDTMQENERLLYRIRVLRMLNDNALGAGSNWARILRGK